MRRFATAVVKDYYAVLGVTPQASKTDVRKAFFNLAKKYHPDLNSDKRSIDREQAKALFQEINEAHQVLVDEKKRQQYDMEQGHMKQEMTEEERRSSFEDLKAKIK